MTTDIPNTETVGYEGLADTYQMTKNKPYGVRSLRTQL